MPRVAVIVAVHNCEHLIGSCIRSVLGQTFSDLELIVIDDASTDRTVKVVREFNDRRLRLFCLKSNVGPGAARNVGMAQARSPMGAFVDADDILHQARLERMLHIASRYAENVIVYDDLWICLSRNDGGLIPWKRALTHCRLDIDYESMSISGAEFVRHGLGVLKPLLPLDLVKAAEVKHPEDVRNGEDFEFRMRLLEAGFQFVLCNFPGYFYRVHRGALTAEQEGISGEIQVLRRLAESAHLDAATKNAIREVLKRKQFRAELRGAVRNWKILALLRLAVRHPMEMLRLAMGLPSWVSRKAIAKREGIWAR